MSELVHVQLGGHPGGGQPRHCLPVGIAPPLQCGPGILQHRVVEGQVPPAEGRVLVVQPVRQQEVVGRCGHDHAQ